jgi:hypothetical protein
MLNRKVELAGARLRSGEVVHDIRDSHSSSPTGGKNRGNFRLTGRSANGIDRSLSHAAVALELHTPTVVAFRSRRRCRVKDARSDLVFYPETTEPSWRSAGYRRERRGHSWVQHHSVRRGDPAVHRLLRPRREAEWPAYQHLGQDTLAYVSPACRLRAWLAP